MNFSTIIALAMALAVFVVSGATSTDNPYIFMNVHAGLIVFGGTLSAAAISLRMGRLFQLLSVFWHRLIRGRAYDYVPLVRELLQLAEAHRTDSPNLQNMIKASKDPFVRDTMETVTDGFLEGELLERILFTRVNTVYKRYMDDANKVKNLAKFPPAFGLMGAVFGMIGILSNLGATGADMSIGPSLAVALVATLYGIALANLIVLPIAEQLIDSAKEIHTKNTIIVEAALLMRQKESPIMMAEELNAFLLPNERFDWKTVHGQRVA